ncbi:hypothetical protein AB6A40_002265 [Gnathostoma spinigerum]|uniref:F-box domain-containing protein n=1 Tax=Gnathostoma spinigerum TaxID=75299 RepID=A0ABD6E8N9_9BILA
MDSLPSDCLVLIFRHLDFLQRVRLESVCCRWADILRTAYCYSDIQQIDISNLFEATSSAYYRQETLTFTPAVIGILRRCGHSIHKVSFGQRWWKISQSIIDAITNNCAHLDTVDLGSVILDAEIGTLLSNIAGNLRCLSLDETSWIDLKNGDEIQNHFSKMIKLRELNLRRANFNLNRLHEVPSCIENIDISGAYGCPTETLNKFLATHPHLSVINMCPVPNIDVFTIVLISNLSQLKQLSIGYTKIAASSMALPLYKLCACISLQRLHIQNCDAFNDNALRLISASLHTLNSLSIVYCDHLHDYSNISEFHNLQNLIIVGTYHLSDDDLRPLAVFQRLKMLSLQRCYNITAVPIIDIVRLCPISELSLIECEEITDDVLFALASSNCRLTTLSVQGCMKITNKGVSALSRLKNLPFLRELDVSSNRNVNSTAITALYDALRKCVPYRHNVKQKVTDATKENESDKLCIYIFKTSVSKEVHHLVNDLISLVD